MTDDELPADHEGRGEDCMHKAINYGSLGICTALAVLPVSYLNTTLRKSYIKSAPLRPWFIGVSLHVLKTTTLFGAAGATFATASCLSAQLRDKNDYVNAVIGGALGGSLFGLGYRNIHIGVIVAGGAAIFFGLNKALNGSYIPPRTFRNPITNRRRDRL